VAAIIIGLIVGGMLYPSSRNKNEKEQDHEHEQKGWSVERWVLLP
jgi:hypothetical protein